MKKTKVSSAYVVFNDGSVESYVDEPEYDLILGGSMVTLINKRTNRFNSFSVTRIKKIHGIIHGPPPPEVPKPPPPRKIKEGRKVL